LIIIIKAFFRVCCPITRTSPNYCTSSRAKMFANLLRRGDLRGVE